MAIRRDGVIALGTRANLVSGLHSPPMAEAAVEGIFSQAAEFTDLIVNQYGRAVSGGEVGVGGSGRVPDSATVGSQQPSILLYGRVQSGKTAAMVLSTALALDNGFRVVVVLTADNVELVRQTANRFRDLDGPRVLSTADEFDTEGVSADFLETTARDGLVYVCAKNAFRLPQALAFLLEIDAASYPSLVFDDEADAATPDNTLNARSAGYASAPPYASTIHRRVVQNSRPGEEGESTLEILPHSVYIQVTASPFVLVLQRHSSRLRPTCTFLLQPGPGYCGGERFFGEFNPELETADPPLVIVPDREYTFLSRRATPPALAASINFAIVASAAHAFSRGQWPSEGYKHLSHTSPLVTQHTQIAEHIGHHLEILRNNVRSIDELSETFAVAYNELTGSLPDAPSFDSLTPNITMAVRNAVVLRINSQCERMNYGPRMNFLVGGNILGRGLTIDDLLVTYYLRQAQVSQMDTVLQHARMYGYREGLMPYTRVYLPHQLAVLFQEIHQSEEELRAVAAQSQQGEPIPIRVARGSRPTRPSAIEGDELLVFGRNLSQIAPALPICDTEVTKNVNRLLREHNIPLTDERQSRTSRRMPLNAFQELIGSLIPPADDLGRWSVEAMLGLVNQYETAFAGQAVVYVRAFDGPPDIQRTRARLSGDEVRFIQDASPNAPALALLYWRNPDNTEYWFPTLVRERDHSTYIFSPS